MTTSEVVAYFRHDLGAVVITNDEDVDRLVDALLAEPFENSVAAMYSTARPKLASGVPDHELLLAVNADDSVGGLRYMGDGTWYSKGTPSKHDEVYYCYMGSDRDFPHDSEVSLEQLRQAAREFLRSGGQRPTAIPWQPSVSG
ncbi:hypothetical protein GCM10027290_50050 [Micromonospora sonneratiae]|jgi:hypothetical protein|uniref:Imm1 family immunity protein n=1 Tax=Micromonospora sonneratiae TaxID=1184706 RepID=A0ABW3YJP3_9ACTN